ncbi:hypothetical protein IGI04_036484 [Brassica rapa subsp. trilocularis]|uniref:Uncharacterized protein n=1 Tax=Brassica rapa subsp. trilocularis TaxID=1813537 RepID=A0ABQ7LEP2_BRACM|nr:hypothetical protein IGI04_036484 [Brassica rapa subsp. trilocularis]
MHTDVKTAKRTEARLVPADLEPKTSPIYKITLDECMPSSTRSNKETQLLFSSDPASLERSIHKRRRSSSIDNNISSSLDSRQPLLTHTPIMSIDTRSPPSTEATLSSTEATLPSIDIFHPTSIDISVRTSIDTESRDMVATLILVRDDNGDLHDQEGHLRNAADEAARPRTLADYNHPNQFYVSRSAIHPPAIQRSDFELKLQYYTLYIPSSTRSNKENQLLFSLDPASLEHSIHKGIRSSSINNNSSSTLDSRQPPSTQTPILSNDTLSPPSTEATLSLIDIFYPTSIDHHSIQG